MANMNKPEPRKENAETMLREFQIENILPAVGKVKRISLKKSSVTSMVWWELWLDCRDQQDIQALIY